MCVLYTITFLPQTITYQLRKIHQALDSISSRVFETLFSSSKDFHSWSRKDELITLKGEEKYLGQAIKQSLIKR